MKKFHSERAQAACSLITSVFWAVLIGGLIAGFVLACKTWVPGPFWGTDREIMFNVMAVSTISGVILGTCILASLFSLLFGRNTYEVGATELTITTGTFWKSTNTIKILDIESVSRASGPLMRLFGIEDVKLHFSSASVGVTLSGVRNGETLRDLLLSRHDSLREAAEEGTLSVARTQMEIIFERLDRVLERVEHHLPPARRSGS